MILGLSRTSLYIGIKVLGPKHVFYRLCCTLRFGGLGRQRTGPALKTPTPVTCGGIESQICKNPRILGIV